MVRWTPLPISLFFLCLFLYSTSSHAADFSIQVDRHPIPLNESFRLIFETEDSVDGSPDFQPLEQDFEILGKQQSSNLQLINGKRTLKTIWTLTLLAKKSGPHTIPAIAFGDDYSPERIIVVTEPEPIKPGQKTTDLFLEVDATPTETTVQAQIIYTVRFFRSVNISTASLTEPELSANDAVVEKLGDDKKYETTRQGKRHLVVERRYAIFPQKSGHLTIAPVRLEVQTGQQSNRFFNSLFDDPFGQRGQSKRILSKSIELNINPIPSSFQNSSWLPAHRIQLTEKWSETPPQFKIGEPITRTLTLMADGLTSAQLPEIVKSQHSNPTLSGLKQYPDQPTLNDQKESSGIIGIRQEKIALIPTHAGTITLPALEIPWWDTDSKTRQIARLPERTLIIPPLPKDKSTSLTPLPVAPQIQKAPTPKTAAKDQPKPSLSFYDSYGFILTLFLAFGWAATALTWWIKRDNVQQSIQTQKKELKPEKPEKWYTILKQACSKNDTEMCRSSLLSWAQLTWPEQTINTLNDLHQLNIQPLWSEVDRLNQCLFSPTPQTWQGDTLWKAIETCQKEVRKKPKDSDKILPPLYSLAMISKT